MDCPVDSEPMIICEFNDVEVDYCVACSGIWLDAGELELLFGNREVTQGFLTAGDALQKTKEKPRPCPICGKKMAKHTTGGKEPVLYDRCSRGHGMWFDEGELAAILKYGSAAPGGKEVAAWLREMFSEEGEAPKATKGD